MTNSIITDNELQEMFDEFIDQMGEVTVGHYTFSASRVLKQLDPTAYRSELANYADSLSQDGHDVEGY